MYLDCDHCIDENYVYTIRGNWEPDSDQVFAKPVYHRKSPNEAYAKIVDKKGAIGENMVWINPQHMKHVKCRGICMRDFSDGDLWQRMAQEFVDMGIPQRDIGVFGSWRLGFAVCKDVDFIIYGNANRALLQESIEGYKKKLGLYNHTLNHASYQARVHGEHFDDNCNDLLMCLLNKWSTCAFTSKLTTTIRFVDPEAKSGALLRELLTGEPDEDAFTFTGVVSDADGASYMPRSFTVANESVSYQVVTPLWIFHQCVANNDLVTVKGWRIGRRLVVRRYDHGIKFV